ncbi:MAG: response regulator transcription factor [Gammaproteobacteria bacterium]
MYVSAKLQVLVVHRVPVVAAGLEVTLKTQLDFEVISVQAEAGGLPPRDALDAASIVVTDCETGLQLLAARRRDGCGIVIVTGDDSEASIRSALEFGASGYLLLTSSSAAIANAVRRVCEGGSALDPLVATKMMASLAGERLTRRETEVLRLLMVGLSDKAIARSLGRTVGTAKTHLKSIFTKLGATSRTEAVAVARRRGLVSEAPVHAALPFGKGADIRRIMSLSSAETGPAWGS